MIASAVYAAESGVVITSSPAPMPRARSDQRDRVGPVPDADRVGGAGGRGELLLERLDLGTEHEPAARDDAVDRGANVGRVLAGDQRQEGNAPALITRLSRAVLAGSTYWCRCCR